MTPGPGIEPGTHWWKASALTTAPTLLPKAIFSSSVAKNGEVCTPETSCMKGASLHL